VGVGRGTPVTTVTVLVLESVVGSQNDQTVTVLIPGETPHNPRKKDNSF